MKLGIKPNYDKLSRKQLADFFNIHFSETQGVYLKEEGEEIILYDNENDSRMNEINEGTLRTYLMEEAQDFCGSLDFYVE